MKLLPAAVLVIAGTSFASLARAQNTQLVFQASADAGQSWHDRVDVVPGTNVIIRLRVRLINLGTNTVLGLAGITLQPTLSNWNAATDTRRPFLTESDGSGVPEFPESNLGRIFPFASAGMSTHAASGVLTSHVDPGNILRFAGANCITPSTNLAWGVGLGQIPTLLGIREGIDMVVFRYGVRVAGDAERTLMASVNVSDILQQRANWYRNLGGAGNLFAPIGDNVVPATIHVIPAPAALPFLLLTLAASRRRSPRP